MVLVSLIIGMVIGVACFRDLGEVNPLQDGATSDGESVDIYSGSLIWIQIIDCDTPLGIHSSDSDKDIIDLFIY